jgi:hypothetical protein
MLQTQSFFSNLFRKKQMTKKIELNKKTVSQLTGNDIEAISDNLPDDTCPVVPTSSGCPSRIACIQFADQEVRH